MGGKNSDLTAIPLCHRCHHILHHSPKDFVEAQYRWLVQTLNRAAREGVLVTR